MAYYTLRRNRCSGNLSDKRINIHSVTLKLPVDLQPAVEFFQPLDGILALTGANELARLVLNADNRIGRNGGVGASAGIAA